jgi:hypothetical protein
MEAKHDNVTILTIIEGGKRDCLGRQPRESPTEDVGRHPFTGQGVLGNGPGLNHVVAAAQAKTIVGRVKCHGSYLAGVGHLYDEGLFKQLRQQN